MIREENINIRVSEEFKGRVVDEARRRKIKLSKLVTDAVEFYTSFPEPFLDQMNVTAEQTKLSVPVVIQQLLLSYVAADAAVSEVFGASKTFARAFQYDSTGLISGTKLSNSVYDVVKKETKALVRRLKKDAGKEIMSISKDEALILAARL